MAMTRVWVALLLCAASASALNITSHSCSVGGTADGGWSYVSLANVDNLETVAPLVRSAVTRYIATNTTLNCPTETDLDMEYICSQVVDAATNYRVILTAYCDDEDDDDDSWRNEDPIFLEALITVPAAGEPTFNVSTVTAGCPEVDDDELICFLDGHRIRCEAFDDDDDSAPSIFCTVGRSRAEELYRFTCPVQASGTAYTVACRNETLAAMPAWLSGNLTEAFSAWSQGPLRIEDVDFWEMDDDMGEEDDGDK